MSFILTLFSVIKLSGKSLKHRKGVEDLIPIVAAALSRFGFQLHLPDVKQAWRLTKKPNSPILIR